MKSVIFYHKNLNAGGAERVLLELFKGRSEFQLSWGIVLGSESGELMTSADSEWFIPVKLPSASFLERGLRKLGFPIRTGSELILARGLAYLEEKLGSSTYQSIKKDIILHLKAESLTRLVEALKQNKPEVLVSSLVESGHLVALVALELAYPEGERPVWVATEHNNTLRRIEDYYPETERMTAWIEVTKLVYQTANHVVSVSEGVRDGLVQSFDIPREKISVIYNPVPIEDIRQTAPTQSKQPYLLSAGRLHSQKQFEHLLKAFAEAYLMIPHELWIAGAGSEQVSLESQAEELGIHGRVRFLGVRTDLWALMKSADAFIMSAKYEGFGMTLIEAMAAGSPVISYDVDFGPREFIENGKSGFLVPEGNIQGLSQAILEVLKDKKLSEEIVNHAKLEVSRFDRRIASEQYGKLLLNLVS